MLKPANLDDLAYDVLMDKYGRGDTRKILLGDLYIPVQRRVDEIYKFTCGHPEIWCDLYRRGKEK